MVRLILLLPLLLQASLLEPKLFVPYLKQSPHYKIIEAQKEIAKKRLKESLAPFDTILFGKYEKKNYPLSSSIYEEFGLKKRLFSGVEAFGKYRYAKGVQEFNNIKTGPDGEIQIGASIKINRLFGEDEATLKLKGARIDGKIAAFKAQSEYQKLLRKVFKGYLDLVLARSIVDLDRAMEETLKERKELVKRLIEEGVLPKVALLQIDAAILDQEGRVALSQGAFEAARSNFYSYFTRTFDGVKLPRIEQIVITKPYGDYRQRAEFFILDLKVKKIAINERYVRRNRFGELGATLYGVQDRYYEKNGAKGVVSLRIPLERSGYEGAKERLLVQRALIRSEEAKLSMKIEASIEALVAKIEAQRTRIDRLKKQLSIANRLEAVALKKLKSGIGDLFELNRQSFARLKVQKELVKARAKVRKLWTELLYEYGELDAKKIHTAAVDRSALADEH